MAIKPILPQTFPYISSRTLRLSDSTKVNQYDNNLMEMRPPQTITKAEIAQPASFSLTPILMPISYAISGAITLVAIAAFLNKLMRD
jgi:hypothetical protein